MLALFSTFFYLIGLWYLSLLPLAVFVFILSHGVKNIFSWIKLEILREKRSLILIRFVTMIWLSGILFFIWIQEISVYLTLLIFNIFLRFGSHIFGYEDGKLIFEVWTRIMVAVISGTALFLEWFFVFVNTLLLLASLMLGVFSFLQFIIWIFYPTEKKRTYQIVILAILVIWWAILRRFYPAEWVIPIVFLGLSLLFSGIYVVQHREMPTKQPAMISVRRILAGERIFKKLNIPQRKVSLYEWVENNPKRFGRVLELLNLGLLIFLLLFFFWGIFTSSKISLWLWYRVWIALFLINTFLLKKIWYATDVSRFSLAFIANFVLYSILLITWSSIESILPFLIVWWFLSQMALFYVDHIHITLFSDKDYFYWMIATFIASICNIILLCCVNLPGQFLFSVIFVYVWIELMLLYYIVKFLQDRKIARENAELEEKKLIQELVKQ